jgi:hypothetical protein
MSGTNGWSSTTPGWRTPWTSTSARKPTLFSELVSDKADLGKLRDLDRKVIIHIGLADDSIPPAGNINYYERVAAAMGGYAEVQKFMRLYLVPGAAHSSQGRGYTASNRKWLTIARSGR